MLRNSLLTEGKIRHISVLGMWWLTKIMFSALKHNCNVMFTTDDVMTVSFINCALTGRTPLFFEDWNLHANMNRGGSWILVRGGGGSKDYVDALTCLRF